MSNVGETFFTSIGCMDGRSECAVTKWGREKFGVKYADAITEAGLVGLLAKGNIDQYLLKSLEKKVLISIEKHHSRNVVVSGHQDCAGNPVDDSIHKKDVLKAAKTIAKLFKKDIHIFAVFVKRENNVWIVQKL